MSADRRTVNRGRATTGAVVSLALLLLLATQVWVEAVVEVAPGSPRAALGVSGGGAAPWASAAALLGLAAGALSSVLGAVWTRVLVLVPCLAVLGATVRVVARPAEAVGAGSGQVVSAGATGWAWAAVVTAVLASTAAVTSLVARPAPDPPTAPVTPAERDRRAAAEQWGALDDGQDPTGGA